MTCSWCHALVVIFAKVESTAMVDTRGCNTSSRPKHVALVQVTFKQMFIMRPTNLVLGDAIERTWGIHAKQKETTTWTRELGPGNGPEN